MLKVVCTSAQVLDFADFMKPFKLHMDASNIGLGAVLYQKRLGRIKILDMLAGPFPKVSLVTQPISWNF